MSAYVACLPTPTQAESRTIHRSKVLFQYALKNAAAPAVAVLGVFWNPSMQAEQRPARDFLEGHHEVARGPASACTEGSCQYSSGAFAAEYMRQLERKTRAALA